MVLPRLGRSKDHGAPVGHQVDEELAVLEEVPGRAARQQQELIAARVRRLPRVLGIEIDISVRCGGTLRIIASLEEPPVIARIVAHLQCTGEFSAPRRTNANDKAGHSFSVHVRKDPDHDRLLSAIVADARAGWATKTYVTGTLRTFDAPTNVEKQTGINHGVDASSGVVLGRRPDP